jgi:hypothetical protein
MLQARAAKNLRDALTRPEVAKALDLTPLQLIRIADVEEEAVEIARAVALAKPLPNVQDDTFHVIRDRLDSRTLALLTPAQRAKWKELTGDPVAEFEKSPITGPINRPVSSP